MDKALEGIEMVASIMARAGAAASSYAGEAIGPDNSAAMVRDLIASLLLIADASDDNVIGVMTDALSIMERTKVTVARLLQEVAEGSSDSEDAEALMFKALYKGVKRGVEA